MARGEVLQRHIQAGNTPIVSLGEVYVRTAASNRQDSAAGRQDFTGCNSCTGSCGTSDK